MSLEYYPPKSTQESSIVLDLPLRKAGLIPDTKLQGVASRNPHRKFERRNSRGAVLTPRNKSNDNGLFRQMLSKKGGILKEVNLNRPF